jgi:hypothetical protein
VQRSADSGRTWATVREGVSIKRVTVNGLVSGKRYTFRVSAQNRAGRGQWSAVVHIRAS